MSEKYIDLLLNKCVDFDSKILFINYDSEIKDFVIELSDKAKKLGMEEIYLDEENISKTHDILSNSSIDEIKINSYFNKSYWDEYASRNASFLIIETEHPGVMDDIASEKISISAKIKRESRPKYRKMVENCELSWCIAAYPSEDWAKSIFGETTDAFEKLENAIYKMCMVDDGSAISNWDKQLEKTEYIIKKLNDLKLNKLHYSNSLGTNLEVYLPDGYIFSSAKDNNVIVNMPSYEVFASPVFNKTEGIVYSSMPLNYAGCIVDGFFIKFREGKVIEYDAKKGKDILKGIIESDSNSCYLGECALVEYDSPISNLKMTFGTTLIDENASCHLALGAGFPESIENGIGLSEEELLEKGINVSKNHVDFMIGTNDLSIIGTTKNNEEIPIFIDGNFNKELFK